MPDSVLVVIGTYKNRVDAELAHGVLVADGIDAIVSADDVGGLYAGAVGAVRLLVRSEDADRARESLAHRTLR